MLSIWIDANIKTIGTLASFEVFWKERSKTNGKWNKLKQSICEMKKSRFIEPLHKCNLTAKWGRCNLSCTDANLNQPNITTNKLRKIKSITTGKKCVANKFELRSCFCFLLFWNSLNFVKRKLIEKNYFL